MRSALTEKKGKKEKTKKRDARNWRNAAAKTRVFDVKAIINLYVWKTILVRASFTRQWPSFCLRKGARLYFFFARLLDASRGFIEYIAIKMRKKGLIHIRVICIIAVLPAIHLKKSPPCFVLLFNVWYYFWVEQHDPFNVSVDLFRLGHYFIRKYLVNNVKNPVHYTLIILLISSDFNWKFKDCVGRASLNTCWCAVVRFVHSMQKDGNNLIKLLCGHNRLSFHEWISNNAHKQLPLFFS